MKQCPRCAFELNDNDKVCPKCGLPIVKFEKSMEELGIQAEDTAQKLESEAESKQLNRAQKKEKKRLAKLEKKEAKRQKKLAESKSTTDFSRFATNSENRVIPAKKADKNSQMQFQIDENGEFNIDTADVEIIGEKTGKILEERQKQTYSLKKARGDYRPQKIKWWEIYKIADRMFARRKIKKEVAKASRVRPDFISKTKLLLFSIFFGWFGLHNFYAKNKKKGFVSLFCVLISFGTLAISTNETARLWLCGFPGFILLMIWITDVVNIIFNKFAYRIQKEKFISGMNIETRAKLGEKYIDLDLLQKPWYVRFKVWWQKKKKNYQEWKHDRRQALIEKEKAKLASAEEKNNIEKEIAEFEQKENESLKKKKTEQIQENQTQESAESQKEFSKPKKAKISVKTNNKKSSKKK